MEERKFWIVVAITLAISFVLNLRFAFWPVFDFATSVLPGWHTTIFSPWQILRSIFFFICIVALILFFIFRHKKSKP